MVLFWTVISSIHVLASVNMFVFFLHLLYSAQLVTQKKQFLPSLKLKTLTRSNKMGNASLLEDNTLSFHRYASWCRLFLCSNSISLYVETEKPGRFLNRQIQIHHPRALPTAMIELAVRPMMCL